MHLTTRELSVNLWSESTPAHERLSAHIHALAPGARIAPGVTQNQLYVVLDDTDANTVAALDALLRNDFREAVFSYRWHTGGATLA